MVYKKLSEEDKIIIKYLRQKFGYGAAKRIIKNHPEKNWGLRNVGYLLKKIDETGDVKRREGSGRPKTSRTENCGEEGYATINKNILPCLTSMSFLVE